jgi:dolichol-phosphate mannosyltransferase
VFLAVSAFLFLLADARYRPWLARKEPYLAACIALLIFTPVILWNIRHHWASFNFQVTDRMNVETARPLRRFMEFVLMQLGVTSPVLLAGLILTPAIPMSFGLKLRRTRWRFALIFALPLLIFLLGYSTRAAIKANWPAPAYLTLLIAAYPAYRYLRFNSGPRSRSVAGKFVTIWLWALPVMYLGAIYHSIVVFPGVPVHHWTTGWREMGDIVRAEADKLEASDGKRVFLLGLDTHYVASALTFYAGDKHPVFSRNLVGKRALAFEYWRPDPEPIGWNAVAVDFEPPVTEMLKRYFVRVDDQPERVPIRRGDRLLHYVYLVHCYGYKGKGSGTARRTGGDLR